MKPKGDVPRIAASVQLDPEVAALMRELDHPLKAELQSLGRGKTLEANLPAFEALVRAWIRWV